MGSSYNRIAGQRLDRLCALSDGVFAVAMTLLVLDLHVPVAAAIHSERELGQGLLALAPRVVPYLMSFLTLGIFWVGQQTLLNTLVRGDRNLSWIQIAFLLAVSITPFSTALLASFVTYRLALVIYWLDLVALGLTILWSSRYAQRRDLSAMTFLLRRVGRWSAASFSGRASMRSGRCCVSSAHIGASLLSCSCSSATRSVCVGPDGWSTSPHMMA